MKDEVTVIDTPHGNMYVCDNCGAHAEEGKEIGHHKSCKPGESKRWENFYEKANEEG